MNNWNSVNLLDCGYSGLFGMFLTPVLVNNNCANNDRKCEKCAKYDIKKIRSLHLFYTSLSRMIPKIIRTKNNANPGISRANLIPAGDTTGPKISIAHTNLAISYTVFANPFRWFLSSFITSSVAKTKLFVKLVGSLPGTFAGGIRSFLNPVSVPGSKNYFGGYGICGGDVSSGLFGVFLTPVLVQNYCAKDKGNQNSAGKQNVDSFHNYSPLSASNPITRNMTKEMNPPTKISLWNFSGARNWPITRAVKIYLLKSRNTLAKFSLCRLVSFIKKIIPKTKLFVKLVRGWLDVFPGIARIFLNICSKNW